MKQTTTYGKEAASHAKILISHGWTNEEIRAVGVCKDIPADKLRLWRFRMKPKKETANETPETLRKTSETAYITGMSEQEQNPILDAKNDVLPVSKTFQSVSFWQQWRDNFHPADLLYYLAVSLAAVGIVQALHMVGYPVAALFCAGAFIALHGIKTTDGWKSLPHFAIMAVIEAGSFAAHSVWANKALWDGVRALPLDIWEYKYTVEGVGVVAEWHGSDLEVPGKIAIGIASFMLACTVYVCWLAIQNSKSK